MATNISGFFHNHHWWPEELAEKCRDDCDSCIDALKSVFLATYPHELPTTWFDWELGGQLGIDFFQQEFPRARGYNIYGGGGAGVLVIRLENIAQCVNQALSEFLQLDHFRMLNSNQAKDKWYYSAYRAFLNRVVLPDSYLDRLYRCEWYRYFYSHHEISSFRARWSGRGTVA